MGRVPSRAEVVIIGGGIIGTSIAYYLAKKGMREVLLLEKGLMGEGSTGKCVGGIRTQFSTEINVRFSSFSLKVFDRFKAEFGLDPEFHRVGYLFLAARESHWKTLKATGRLLQSMGLGITLLEPEEIKHRWPFLHVGDLLGGSYTESDGTPVLTRSFRASQKGPAGWVS